MNLIFLIKLFLLYDQKVKKKIKIFLERKDETKCIFYHFQRGFIEANKANNFFFLEGESLALKNFVAIIFIFWRVADLLISNFKFFCNKIKIQSN